MIFVSVGADDAGAAAVEEAGADADVALVLAGAAADGACGSAGVEAPRASQPPPNPATARPSASTRPSSFIAPP